MEGQLKSIWIKRMKRGQMDPVERVMLEEGEGIAGNANRGGRRQVTIIQQESWDEMMMELDASADPSIRRANLLISGLELGNSRGRELVIGECRINILGETTPCYRMDEALPGLQAAMQYSWRGGVYGTVIRGGEINTGDPVRFAHDERTVSS